jgi:hypothetical protein
VEIPETIVNADQDSEMLEDKELEGFLFKKDGPMVNREDTIMVENKEEMPETLLDTESEDLDSETMNTIKKLRFKKGLASLEGDTENTI